MQRYTPRNVIVYIAGLYSDGDKLSKRKQKKNREAFLEAQKYLYENGYNPINPIELDYELKERGQIDYKSVLGCDLGLVGISSFILMLPKWYLSNGAVAEWIYAHEIGIPILYELPGRIGGEEKETHR